MSTQTKRFLVNGFGLFGWLLLCFTSASLGAFFMPGEWYAGLAKPSWNPPNWLFGPVWTALYIMMVVSAWLVWRQGGIKAQRRPLGLFLVQLLLNAVWTPLFFGLHRPGLAFLDIIVLWFTIALTIVVFWRIHRAASILLWPYLAWVSFATVLNGTLWWLNR